MISAQKISSAVTVVALLQLCAVQRTEAKGSEEGWLHTVEGELTVDLAKLKNLKFRCKNPKHLTDDNISQIKQDAMNYQFLYLEEGQEPNEKLRTKMRKFDIHYKKIKPEVWEKMGNLICEDLKNHQKGVKGDDADVFKNIKTVNDFNKAVHNYDKIYPSPPVYDFSHQKKKPRATRQISRSCPIGGAKSLEALHIEKLSDAERQMREKADYSEIEPSLSSKLNIDFDDLEESVTVSELASTADQKSVDTELEYSLSGTCTKSSVIDADEEEPTETEAPESVSLSSGRRRRLAMARLVAAECSQF